LPREAVFHEDVAMTSIDTGRMPTSILAAAVVVSCALLAAHPAPAQEAPAAGGDVPHGADSAGDAAKGPAADPDAAPPPRDLDLVPPRRGTAGLWRPTDMKALIPKRSNRAAGLPPANTPRIAPLPARPGTYGATPRNAIGTSISPRQPGPEPRGITPLPGTRPTTGTTAGNGGTATRPTPVPAIASQTMHGTAINGTTMGRLASGPASIGGPAKDRSAINGTLLKPKH
jgi:hypothetical protein